MKKPTAKPQGTKLQTAPQGGAAIGKIEPAKAAAPAAEPKKPFNPGRFIKEVRQEAAKITWTSRKETWITTVMVLIMVVLAGVFFFIVDGALGYLTSLLTKIGQG